MGKVGGGGNTDRGVFRDIVHIMSNPLFLSIDLSLNTATRPRGHFRQVSAASVSIRQEKIKYRQRIKSMIVKDKNR